LKDKFKEWLSQSGLIGIFRGVQPDEVVDVVGAAINKGLSIVEVPLNSPEPLRSIQTLSQAFSGKALVGAGTVTSVEEVDAVAEADGKLIVTPYARTEVVIHAKKLGLFAVPGALTPTEISAMYAVGADAVKIFPAEMMMPTVLKGLRAVLPSQLLMIPVGGISLDNMAAYTSAGANGFGLGSSLYRVGDNAESVALKAESFVNQMKSLKRADTT